MKKIYILVINDLRNVGYNCKDVEVFTDEPSATERMTELYLKAFKECRGEDEDPFDNGNHIDYQHTGRYAYIFGEYYFDIFEKEI
jgi:hypothetical protein